MNKAKLQKVSHSTERAKLEIIEIWEGIDNHFFWKSRFRTYVLQDKLTGIIYIREISLPLNARNMLEHETPF